MYNPRKHLLKVSKIVTHANPYISLTGSLVLQHYYNTDLKREVGDLDFIVNNDKTVHSSRFRKEFIRKLKKFGYGVKLNNVDSDGYPFTGPNDRIFWKGIIFDSNMNKIPFDLVFLNKMDYNYSVNGFRSGIRISKRSTIWEAKFAILKYKKELYDRNSNDDIKVKAYNHIRKISLDIYHTLHAYT